ncbi:HeH/LEM domain-containing protein [Streptococcus sp. 3764]
MEKQVIEEEHLTVVELKSSLDELGIHYEKNAKKSELLSLYKSHKG